MDDLMNLDLYQLIGASPTASVKEIKTAYRKKALTCHPDKNPDNPKAGELFHELSRALEILIDESARAAYDKVLHARCQAKLRVRELDSKRRKFKEDLEAREEAYRLSQQGGGYSGKSDEDRLKAEIERLQKEGSKQVEEEVAFVRQKIFEQLHGHNKSAPTDCRIKLKWKVAKDDSENGGYNYDVLHRMLSKYGDIGALVISSNKNGRALVEYKEATAAEMAAQIESGLAQNPLVLELMGQAEKKTKRSATETSGSNSQQNKRLFPSAFDTNEPKTCSFLSFASAPDIFRTQPKMTDAQFETSVLDNMRRAQERKRLLEELRAEEGT
ncbi:dnaJ homolog subfamily C member 17 [Orussus abietinus]|uniref:dnaJ homolog subfamily C member 17 n=1 Tax=Orussus abietinus TaxID=222816 RepID=UPI000626087B|nr:dnaJ homolog subfamily C member 17 [Orussus abietinus]